MASSVYRASASADYTPFSRAGFGSSASGTLHDEELGSTLPLASVRPAASNEPWLQTEINALWALPSEAQQRQRLLSLFILPALPRLLTLRARLLEVGSALVDLRFAHSSGLSALQTVLLLHITARLRAALADPHAPSAATLAALFKSIIAAATAAPTSQPMPQPQGHSNVHGHGHGHGDDARTRVAHPPARSLADAVSASAAVAAAMAPAPCTGLGLGLSATHGATGAALGAPSQLPQPPQRHTLSSAQLTLTIPMPSASPALVGPLPAALTVICTPPTAASTSAAAGSATGALSGPAAAELDSAYALSPLGRALRPPQQPRAGPLSIPTHACLFTPTQARQVVVHVKSTFYAHLALLRAVYAPGFAPERSVSTVPAPREGSSAAGDGPAGWQPLSAAAPAALTLAVDPATDAFAFESALARRTAAAHALVLEARRDAAVCAASTAAHTQALAHTQGRATAAGGSGILEVTLGGGGASASAYTGVILSRTLPVLGDGAAAVAAGAGADADAASSVWRTLLVPSDAHGDSLTTPVAELLGASTAVHDTVTVTVQAAHAAAQRALLIHAAQLEMKLGAAATAAAQAQAAAASFPLPAPVQAGKSGRASVSNENRR